MVEKGSISIKREVRSIAGAIGRGAVNTLLFPLEIPHIIEIIKAPDGELVDAKGDVEERGLVIDYGGNKALLTPDHRLITLGPDSQEKIRTNLPKKPTTSSR